MSILDACGSFEGRWGPIPVTISMADRVGVVEGIRAPNPLATLVLVGVRSGLLAMLLQQLTCNLFLDGPPGAPLLRYP